MLLSHRRTVIAGVGSSIPEKVVPNDHFRDFDFYMDYGQPVDRATNPNVIDKFHQITDISERRYAADDQVASDLATEAGAAAIEAAGIDPETLDYIVVGHNFGDVAHDRRYCDFLPSLATRAKQLLGIANPSCVAYDLPFGCPGWLQGVIQNHYFLQSGDAQRALVIGAETISRVSDPHDRDSMIYADGGGAVVLEAREDEREVGILAHAARTDAIKHARLLWMGPSYRDGHEPDRLFVKMYGRKLYTYALNHVPGVVKESLDRAGLDLSDVRKIFLHQANAKMDEAIVERLFRLYRVENPDIEAVLPMNISKLGNSSVATIPTLLDMVLKGEITGHEVASGDVVVFASVGAGMNVNSVVYRWP
ncbi:MAG: ketoacyl-ACP synthase III [Thermoanaerobaculales bacterium]|jgi:3-oxoacyl-[acyl-carrier-protein] synthase-3|nr:ketoacyl-ACP synthase III [Thermoanaerobaculales bacterium]